MSMKIIPDVVNEQKIQGVTGSMTIREAAKIMAKHHIGALLVTKRDKLEGILTERDLSVKIVAGGMDPDKTKVSQIMTKNPETVSPDDTALSALEKMKARGFRHLPVVDGDRIVGMVSVRDLYSSAKSQLEDDLKDRDAFIFGAGYGA
ncbi:MAG: CBS domain-containing protein [Alphaproteobacteria bacterium]|nr:CBS domain-containing protein [Alphaproteobacteria bacterium]